MNMTLKSLFAALLLSLSLGLSSNALAQAVAPINVNAANAELLSELPGIGPSRAAAIIEERDAKGEFTSADDLTRVSGIGAATVDRMRDQIVLED
ncbi:DNA uptake protein and related DNA-binding proteins [Halomonas citrativorans]|uniref:DNA uptake protein and related DNA-binding proteins n=1 Tax=Halomonas citrativorans TaxID=2742612 RepID=A0A1R4HTX3_9GAMM|nr:ComEA family DNA-binding protein [Halomonas citrativorans]SJN10936.1 DNA uptake protein and related DNA-binding proteins [Halomonas citrativorans]